MLLIPAICSVQPTKDGTLGLVQLLISEDVDVIFGPICSSGTQLTCLWHR